MPYPKLSGLSPGLPILIKDISIPPADHPLWLPGFVPIEAREVRSTQVAQYNGDFWIKDSREKMPEAGVKTGHKTENWQLNSQSSRASLWQVQAHSHKSGLHYSKSSHVQDTGPTQHGGYFISLCPRFSVQCKDGLLCEQCEKRPA